MKKIKTLTELSKICQELKKQGKIVGLITGCFDILHLGHIELFRFAKKHVDILVVGLDNDESLRLSKGENRPIFSQEGRAQVLLELKSVDYIFVIDKVVKFDTEEANYTYKEIIQKLKPSALITNSLTDRWWRERKQRAKKLGIGFIDWEKRRLRSSSKIIQILENEL